MATIVGGIGVSHVPTIGSGIAKGLQQTPYFKPFFDGFTPVHAWIDQVKPDVAVVIYNDHGLNFFLDKMPTFAIGAAAQYQSADEGWGLPVAPPFKGCPELSWKIIEGLVEQEFDPTTCQQMLVDHAFAIPMDLLWPAASGAVKIPAVPVSINTVQHPLPKAGRCYRFGQAIGRAIEDWESDARVLIVGTGGMSHQLDGARAGFINKAFDQFCLDKLVDDPEALTAYTISELVELAGSQGVELLMWLAMRGALTGEVRELSRTYHIPISNTAAGIQLLENTPRRSGLKAA
jgi:protocatechuate 4,5-dioxygenase beta chain